MSIDTRNLTGARASSAVRCMAKAEHEALGTTPTNDTPAFLERAFKRGVNVGRAWAMGLTGNVTIEAEIPWGPGWVGHADVIDEDTKTVYEAYHAAGGAFREEKALQAAFYADSLGPEYGAELAVIDTTDVHDEEGFAVQPYEINVDALRTRVREIKARVIAAVKEGAWNPDDRVSDTPHHSECRTCPFSNVCHANYQPPHPEEIVGLEDTFVALKVTDADRKATAASLKRINERRDDLIEQITEYVPENQTIRCGDVTVKRTTVAGGLSFSLTDALKAGHALPDELAAFAKPRKGYDKWEIQT